MQPPDDKPDRVTNEIDGLARKAASFAADYPWNLRPEDLARHKRRSARRVRARVGTLVVAGLILVVFVAPLPRLHLFGGGKHLAVGPGSHPSSTTTTAPVIGKSSPAFTCAKLDLWTAPTRTEVTTTATLGAVAATLSGTTTEGPGGDVALSHPVLVVTVSGRRLYRLSVVAPAQAEGRVIPWDIAPPAANKAPNSDALCLARFSGTELPTVLLGLFTGGAHCCTVLRAIGPSSNGPAPSVDDYLGNADASLSSSPTGAVIVSADNAFAYAFTDFADSALPIMVLQFKDHRFLDITAHHADLVTQDATTLWKNFNQDRADNLGILAAWVADECVVGQGPSAWKTVDRLKTEGRLVGTSGWDAWPVGTSYVPALREFLAKHRYCSR